MDFWCWRHLAEATAQVELWGPHYCLHWIFHGWDRWRNAGHTHLGQASIHIPRQNALCVQFLVGMNMNESWNIMKWYVSIMFWGMLRLRTQYNI
jgi:hypothetical protein